MKKKNIIITGATSGIGKALAKFYSKSNHSLVLTGSSEKKLKFLSKEINSKNNFYLKADLTKPKDIKSLVNFALNKLDQIDILVANAGIYEPSEIISGDPNKWDRVIQVNVNSVFRIINLILPNMVKNNLGDILILSSISGHQAIRWEPVYSATKHAIQSFAHGLRTQVAKHNIRVISIAPGVVLTELWGYDEKKDKKIIEQKVKKGDALQTKDVVNSINFALNQPRNVTIRDLVLLPRNQDL